MLWADVAEKWLFITEIVNELTGCCNYFKFIYMKTKKVNIDFGVMQKTIKIAVKEKALQFGSSIIYLKDGELIEENPRAKTIRSIKREYAS